ncbi:MAG: hypothetical protein ACYDG6_14530 [Thermincolia bacterium]
MNETSKEKLKRLKNDFPHCAKNLLKIRTKKGTLELLILNAMQTKIDATIEYIKAQGKPVRLIVLKYRQGGCSTYTEGRIFHSTSFNKLTTSWIVAHEEDASTNLFNMSKLFYDELPTQFKPMRKASNAKEIVFENPTSDPEEKKTRPGLRSKIKISTARNAKAGRSDTIHNLHASEVAFWPDAETSMLALMQAVPNTPNTMVILESTANGIGGYFYDMWHKAKNGENEFVPLFFAWFEEPAYRMPVPSGFTLTAEEEKLKDTYDLKNEQLVWRRWCIANNCGGDKELFKQEYPSNDDEAFLVSGRPVFDIQKIIMHKEHLKKLYKSNPPKQGEFRFKWNDPDTKDKILDESIEFVEKKDGIITIYEDVQQGYPYVIGGDTKGEGRDKYAGKVLNNVTGKRCATLHMQANHSKPYTHQMYCLGRYYNTALIGIEINFNTAPIEELERLNYPRQYTRQQYDSFKKEYQKKYGWKTDGNTRPLIIDKEIDLIENNIDLFTDIAFLDECLSFVYDENGRPDAMTGKHDDILISDMIANEIRGQQSFVIEDNSVLTVEKLPKDLQEDYYNAPESERPRLLKKWGLIK